MRVWGFGETIRSQGASYRDMRWERENHQASLCTEFASWCADYLLGPITLILINEHTTYNLSEKCEKKNGTCLEVASVPDLRSGSTFLKLLDWESSWRLRWSKDMTLKSGSNHCSEMRVWRIRHGVDLGRVEFSEERLGGERAGRGGWLTNSLICLYFSPSICSVWCLALLGAVGLRLMTQTCFAVSLHRQFLMPTD